MKLVLDLLFVLVFHWGVWGAGFATSIAQWLSGLGLFLYDRKFLHSEETILKMPAFMRAPKQDDY